MLDERVGRAVICFWLSVSAAACDAEDAFANDPGLGPACEPSASAARDAGKPRDAQVSRDAAAAMVAAHEITGDDAMVEASADRDATPTEDSGQTPTNPGDAASAPQPEPISIAGSALEAGCSSYGMREGDRCAGFYCGITETELAAALDSPVCPTITAALLCDGTFGRVTSNCAREVTAANLLDTNEQLRPKIFACIAKAIPSASTWPPGCRACALDGVECGSEKCSIQCAAGDGPGCDRCRVESGCNAAAYDCAQLPNPL